MKKLLSALLAALLICVCTVPCFAMQIFVKTLTGGVQDAAPVTFSIAADAWKAAPVGQYRTTLTYTAAVV